VTAPTPPGPGDTPPRPARPRSRSEESLLRGGARGIALVTAATLALAAAGALIALVVSLLY
jgi:hypothetical protein